MKIIVGLFVSVVAILGGWFAIEHSEPLLLNTEQVFSGATSSSQSDSQHKTTGVQNQAPDTITNIIGSPFDGEAYTHEELLAMAGNTFADGNLPLGDKKYVTSGPKKGYIYLCRTMGGGGGAQADGPWIKGATWNINKKISVLGTVSWPTATFSELVSGALRKFTGNGLPKGHTTGNFPIATSDPAYMYDRNPNSLKAQSLSYSLPLSPSYSSMPNCVGGEVGVMLSGVPIFNGFDAEMRDAAAHEVQDSCEGHPQEAGQYHYHSLSSCFKDIDITSVLGYALDGFPITGPVVEDGRYLTTDDLDECHGLTSEVELDGKRVTTYHYVMTMDFPYSVSCFRGKPSTTGPTTGGVGQQKSSQRQTTTQSGMQGGPPAEALSACVGKSESASCSFSAPNGTIHGVCRTTPDNTFACVP